MSRASRGARPAAGTDGCRPPAPEPRRGGPLPGAGAPPRRAAPARREGHHLGPAEGELLVAGPRGRRVVVHDVDEPRVARRLEHRRAGSGGPEGGRPASAGAPPSACARARASGAGARALRDRLSVGSGRGRWPPRNARRRLGTRMPAGAPERGGRLHLAAAIRPTPGLEERAGECSRGARVASTSARATWPASARVGPTARSSGCPSASGPMATQPGPVSAARCRRAPVAGRARGGRTRARGGRPARPPPGAARGPPAPPPGPNASAHTPSGTGRRRSASTPGGRREQQLREGERPAGGDPGLGARGGAGRGLPAGAAAALASWGSRASATTSARATRPWERHPSGARARTAAGALHHPGADPGAGRGRAGGEQVGQRVAPGLAHAHHAGRVGEPGAVPRPRAPGAPPAGSSAPSWRGCSQGGRAGSGTEESAPGATHAPARSPRRAPSPPARPRPAPVWQRASASAAPASPSPTTATCAVPLMSCAAPGSRPQ